jgi:hypothetical protein
VPSGRSATSSAAAAGPGSRFRHDVPASAQAGLRLTATLQWDIFNVFNTVNFGIPNKDISTAATFGTISSLSSDPRTMQIAIRFAF